MQGAYEKIYRPFIIILRKSSCFLRNLPMLLCFKLSYGCRKNEKRHRVENPTALDFIGGDNEIRTHDPLLARQVLSQLSYTPAPTKMQINLQSNHPIMI